MATTSPVSLSLSYRAENKRFSTLKRTKTGGIQPKLNVAYFVQSCFAVADFVVFSNYCLIGTRRRLSFFLPCEEAPPENESEAGKVGAQASFGKASGAMKPPSPVQRISPATISPPQM